MLNTACIAMRKRSASSWVTVSLTTIGSNKKVTNTSMLPQLTWNLTVALLSEILITATVVSVIIKELNINWEVTMTDFDLSFKSITDVGYIRKFGHATK